MAASNFVSNPIVVTGSMATSYKAQFLAATPNAGQPTAGHYGSLFTLIVEKIYWLNPLNISDQITIGDPISGLTLLNLRCEVANQSQLIDWTSNPKLWQDFQIDVFGSGTLYIYTR